MASSFAVLHVIIFAVSLSVESATGMPLPLKHSPLGAFSAAHVPFPELAFYSISITAILLVVVGTFILGTIGRARVLSILERFSPRDATLRRAISLLPLFSLPFTVADGAGRLPPRRGPARRGGVVYPLAASRRGRWYQRQNHTSTV